MRGAVRHGEGVLINTCFGGSGKASWRRQHLSRVQEGKHNPSSPQRVGESFVQKRQQQKSPTVSKTLEWECKV